MTLPTASQEAAEQAMLERRRERTRALRACRVHERAFLKQLPKSGYSPHRAGLALKMSSRTVWKMQSRPRVKRVIELFLQDALDEIGVSHASLVADLVEVKERCLQHRPVLDAEGKPVLVPLADGKLAAAYVFDAKSVIAATKALMELHDLVPAQRVEFTGAHGGPIETVTTHITEDMDAEESARVYQEIIRGRLQ